MSSAPEKDKKAYHLLEHPENYPGLLARREFDRQLLLFRYPSFEPSTSWSLYNTNKLFWVRRIEWDRSKWFPSKNAKPYTFGCESSYPSDLAEDKISSLSAIKFCPLQQPNLIGIDGSILLGGYV